MRCCGRPRTASRRCRKLHDAAGLAFGLLGLIVLLSLPATRAIRVAPRRSRSRRRRRAGADARDLTLRASPGRAAVHPAPAGHRRDDADAGDLVRRAGDGVALEHDEVGGVARQQPPEAALGVARVGRAAPEAVERELDGERLARPASRASRPPGRRRAGRAARSARRSRSTAARRSPPASRARRRRRSARPRRPRRAGGRRVRARAASRRSRRARRSARRSSGCEQLRVLDARPQPARLPALARRLERVEHRAVGARRRSRARRGRGPHRRSGPASSRSSSAPSSASPRPASANGSSMRGGARAERAVGEGLDRPDAQPLVAEAAAQPERDDLVEPLGRQRRPDAQRQAAVGVAGAARPRGRARAGSRGCR